MVSSLATQLAQGASLNAPILSENQRKKHSSVSYLFTSSKHGTDDLDALLALAQNAFAQLEQLNPSFSDVEEELFSHKARDTDRTLLKKSDVDALDEAIGRCLKLLGPWLMEDIVGRVLEWLVKRFRINEFNVPQVLSLFLPYHESPHFAKMVTILHIDQNSPFAFLIPYKSAGKPVSRTSLVSEMLKSSDLTRSILSLLPAAFTGIGLHRTLACFNTSIMLEYVSRASSSQLNAETVAMILPALLTPLGEPSKDSKPALRKDCILGSYVLLSALSQRCRFSPAALSLIIKSMIHGARSACSSCPGAAIDAHQLLTAMISVLSPHDALEGLPADVVDDFVNFKKITTAMRDSFAWAGVEKVYLPMLSRTVNSSSSKKSAAFLDCIISANSPQTLVQALIKLILRVKVLANDGDGGKFPALLSATFQRHEQAFRSAVEELFADNSIAKNDLDNILLGVSSSYGKSGSLQSTNDVVIAVSSSNLHVRTAAARKIAQLLVEVDTTEQASLRELVQTRIIAEDSHLVLAALYESAKSAPSILNSNVIKAVSTKLASSHDISKNVIKAHVEFFCNAGYDSDVSIAADVFLELVLPYAYYTRRRWKATNDIWEILRTSKLMQGELDILKGTDLLVLPAVGKYKDGEDEEADSKPSPTMNDMADFNILLVAKVAANIKSSDDCKKYTEWLCAGLAGASNRAQPLHLLVSTKLLEIFEGDQQVCLASSVVEALKRCDDVDCDMSGVTDMDAFADETLRSLVHKPNAASTAWKLRACVILAATSVPSPNEANIDWLCDSQEVDNVSKRYLRLCHSLYDIINSSTTYQPVAFPLNSRLFEHFGAGTLLFLAGILTSLESAESLKQVALKHAFAFVHAQKDVAGGPCDFQTIIPSLVQVLQSPEEPTRSAAVECLEALNESLKAERPSAIYALDTAYGLASAALQYLEWSDERKYLAVLNQHRGSLKTDPEYIRVVHAQYLGSKADSKKENKAKQRILCYLLSHVVCCPNYSVKASLLRSLEHVNDRVKLHMLLPAIEIMSDKAVNVLSRDQNEFTRLALGSFNKSAVKELNATDGDAWRILIICLKQYHSQGANNVMWATVMNSLGAGTFQALGLHRQVELCLLLLNLGSQADEPAFGIRPLLAQVMKAPSLILIILKEVCKPATLSPDRVRKKAKLDGLTMSIASDKTWMTPLTVFLEALASQELPGSLELVSALLEVLGRVAGLQDVAQSEISYLEQLLMTAIESSALQIKELPNIASSAVRVDILVDLIRTSNPQTFNQALLLMASLARLSPDSVLHNVMPIFTFMGSNVFHRDDQYSFKVIQKTTESIVPVVVKSLKRKHEGTLALYLGARDFLRTFTDASTHIPRHRRTSFFTHLVEVLGSDDFLAPICMLLTEKSSNRVPRQSLDEASSTLSLPLTIFQHYSIKQQVNSMKNILLEVQRLQAVDEPGANAEKAFMELSYNEDHAVSPSSYRRRQCVTLLAFIGHAIRHIRSKQETDEGLLEAVSLLLELATTDENTPTESVEIVAAAQWALSEVLLTISAVDFVKVVSTMLRSTDKKIISGALRLLGDRLPLVTPSAREDVSQSVAEVITIIRDILASPRDAAVRAVALSAIRTIAISAQSHEESALSAIVPTILDLLRSNSESDSALSALPPLIIKLGPHVIQHIHQIVAICTATSQQSNIASDVSSKSIEVLMCLLKTIPLFFGILDLKAVCGLYMDIDRLNSSSEITEQLGKQLTKKIPSKVLLSAMCSIWPPLEGLNIQSAASRFRRFFELLKRCLRVAPRKDIMENLRVLFEHFQKAIGVRSVLDNEPAVMLEGSVVDAFIELVVKLNESSFRPMFRRLYDWGFGENSGVNEKIAFNKIYKSLLELFKELMTPYMSIVSVGLRETLDNFTAKQVSDHELWKSCIETLSVSIVVDDGAYWRDDRLRQISQPLISQVPTCVDLRVAGGKVSLSNTLLALVERVEEDALLKTINHDILVHARSEDTRVRLYALSCASELWEQHARKLVGFATETATFILECADDDNDDVVRECKRLKVAVEREAGKIEGI